MLSIEREPCQLKLSANKKTWQIECASSIISVMAASFTNSGSSSRISPKTHAWGSQYEMKSSPAITKQIISLSLDKTMSSFPVLS